MWALEIAPGVYPMMNAVFLYPTARLLHVFNLKGLRETGHAGPPASPSLTVLSR